MKINPCPRCHSKMELHEGGGGMKDWPYIELFCSNKNCLWNMRCAWDDIGGKSTPESAKDRLIREWNEGTDNVQKR